LSPKRQIAGFERPKTVAFEKQSKVPFLTHIVASSSTPEIEPFSPRLNRADLVHCKVSPPLQERRVPAG
jgi:hypothetical protein